MLCLCDPLREGISKAHLPLFKPHLKGSARLQGFTLRGQYFFSRALQGFSKASLSLFKPSSQGPCKVCMTASNLSLLCLCDPPREGFSKASVSLFKPFLKGSARLQQGTLPFVQIFLSRASPSNDPLEGHLLIFHSSFSRDLQGLLLESDLFVCLPW